MKRFLWLLLSLSLSLYAVSQTQQGYVKTKGRKGSNGNVVPGKRIVGATVQVKGRNAVITQANGVFSFPIPANRFYIQSVKKQGYVLTDPEMLTKQYVFSSNPLILVLETAEQQTDDNQKRHGRKVHPARRQLSAEIRRYNDYHLAEGKDDIKHRALAEVSEINGHKQIRLSRQRGDYYSESDRYIQKHSSRKEVQNRCRRDQCRLAEQYERL